MWNAVIFDVDGTLLDTEKLYMEAWRLAGAAAGFTVTHDVLLRTRAIPESVGKQILRDALGEAFDYEAIRQERIRISEVLIEQCDQLLKPGCLELLQALKRRNIPMAVASSTPIRITAAHLEHAGLLDYFGAVVGGDMVQRGKPNPDIFWKAADLLGVSYGECLVVGDTPADVKAAAAAGMQVILIPDQVPANEETTALSLAVAENLDVVLRYL